MNQNQYGYQQPQQQQGYAQQQQPMQQQQNQHGHYGEAPNQGYDPYAGAEGADVSGGRPFARRGQYWLLFQGGREKWKDPQNRRGNHRVSNIADFRVVRVLTPDSLMPVGAEIASVHKDSSSFYLSDLKKLVGGFTAKDPVQVTGPELAGAFKEQQTITGLVCEVTITEKEGQTGTGEQAFFARFHWGRVVPATEIQATLSPDEISIHFPTGIRGEVEAAAQAGQQPMGQQAPMPQQTAPMQQPQQMTPAPQPAPFQQQQPNPQGAPQPMGQPAPMQQPPHQQ